MNLTWKLLIDSLINLFFPIFLDWIRDQLRPVVAVLEGDPDYGDPALIDPPVAVARVFEAAIDRCPWWRFARRAALQTCKRVALAHVGGIVQAAKYGDPPPRLSADEKQELENL